MLIQDKENVTIIIATHNNAKTIERAIQSVTKGIRPCDQLIIGDNDSGDGTYDVLCKLLKAEPITVDGKTGLPPDFDGKFNNISVKIFRKRLSTTANTVNVALQMKWQKTSIFGFMDPTSWYAFDKIAQAVGVFQQHPAVACVISDCDKYHPDGRTERVFRSSFDIQRLLANYEYDRNFLVRAQVFPKLKAGFNEKLRFMDDYDLLLRISEIGLIYHIPAPLHTNIVQKIDPETEHAIVKYTDIAKQLTAQRRGKPNG